LIAQFVDVINRDELTPGNTITGFSPNRFFNDRHLSIPADLRQPRLRGMLEGAREIYILYLKINPATPFLTLRLRITEGGIISCTRGIRKERGDTASIDVKSMAEKPLAVCFFCSPARATWSLGFGTDDGFDSCPLVADFFALIRASGPKDGNTMELPRFISGIRNRRETLGDDLRGSIGQPYGRTVRQLRAYSAEFRHVKKHAIEDYYDRVSTTRPHFIVPYPESVDVFPPIWCTLATAPEFRKRNVNGWHFDVRLSWREAY